MTKPSDLETAIEHGVDVVVKSRPLTKLLLIVCAVISAMLIGSLFGARYGVLLPQGRMLIEAKANGLKLGRLGKLRIRGLEGDIWRKFTVKSLTISDEKGVWLSADGLSVSWHLMQLFSRNLHVDQLAAQHVTVLRRPTLTPKEKSKNLPVSVRVDAVAARLELMPAFSLRRGLFDVRGKFGLARHGGGPVMQLVADSLLHQGDHLNLDMDLATGHPLAIHADVTEAQGGALAGTLGLAVDAPLLVKADVGGTTSRGQIRIATTSGTLHPITVEGGWTDAGGLAKGRISLTASSLTRDIATRLGPELSFLVTGRKTTSSLYDFAGQVSADNLAVTGRGLGDPGTRELGSAGLQVVADAKSLSALTGGPATGVAHMDGTLKGKTQDWKFSGQGRVEQFGMGDYQLASVTGPVTLSQRARQLTVEGSLVGRNGRGTGLVAAMLGSVPKARFEGARLADGRLLLKDLQVEGAGLKVQAQGDRGLLGGLSFKGRAEVSNLARVSHGAGGAVSASWSASQSGVGKPWELSTRATGSGLSTGYGQLDRLIGRTPLLEIKGSIVRGQVSLSQASLVGAAIKATAAGVLSSNRDLRFQLNWSADGPFQAGPVEITGRAKGTGAITGTLSRPRADLLADFDVIDVPKLPLKDAHLVLTFQREAAGASGAWSLNAMSAYGPARAKSDFRLPAAGLDLTGLDVQAGGFSGAGSVNLRGGRGSRADLTLAMSKGAFLDDGRASGTLRIVDGLNGAMAHIDLKALNAVFPGRGLEIGAARLTADGPLSRLPYAASATGATSGGPWSLAGNGILTGTDQGWHADFAGEGRRGRRSLRTTEPAQFQFGGGQTTGQVRLVAADGGRISLDGRWLNREAKLDAQVQGLGMDMVDQDLTGQFDGSLHLAGQGSALSGGFEAKLEGVRGRGADVSEGLGGVLTGRLAGSEVNLEGVLTNGQGLKATANLVLPAEASAVPFRVAINRRKPLHGEVSADGEIKPLWDLFVGGQRGLAGRVRLHGTLGGTLADMRAVGDATMASGQFSDAATGLTLRDVSLTAGLADNTINLVQAAGNDGHGGLVSGQGRVSLIRGGASTLRLDLRAFRLIDNDLATATATGQVTLARSAEGKARLAGALNIDRADVAAKPPTPSGVVPMEVVEINRPVAVGGSLAAPARNTARSLALDVSLKAPRRIFLKGRGLDVELSLDAHVGGTTARPRLSGNARVIRGDYDFAGKRFVFDERGVVYLASNPNDIHLDLSATRDDPALTAVVRIRGTAAKPEIVLTSVPVLPNDEVLSQVLFGRSASQLSPLEAAQLASALSSLAGGGGFDVIGNLKTFAGLDRLSLGGGGQTGVTVSGGKYLTDDVYLELTGGGRDGTAAQVEWRIGRSLSIISKIAGQGDGKLAVRWRKDY